MEDFKKDIESNTIIVGDFKTPLSKMDRSSKQNSHKDNAALNNLPDQMNLSNIYIYRTFHKKKAKCMEHFHAHGTLSKIDRIIGQKTTLNKFKKIEIITSIISDHKGLKLNQGKGKKPKTLKTMETE